MLLLSYLEEIIAESTSTRKKKWRNFHYATFSFE